MNDRFKFRAWNKLIRKYIPNIQDRDLVEGGLSDDDRYFDSYLYDDNFVIEQCTGLKDKNGRLIYEGDIVRVYYDKCVVNWIGWEGHFLITSACTDPLSLEDDLSYQFGEVSESEIEVIGNIHENKNLLEENK